MDVKTRILALAMISASALGACTGNGGKTLIPLPTAYPRPNLPDTAMIITAETPLIFPVNAQARIGNPREGWIDVAYPTLGATTHITFTHTTASEIEEVKKNRMERLMLNAGDRPVDFSEFTNRAGFSIMTAYSEGSTTPLQFLATDDSIWVVSGAVYFASPAAVTASDSIRPMVNAIRRDILRALTELDYR